MSPKKLELNRLQPFQAARRKIYAVNNEASPRFTLRQRIVLAAVPRMVWVLLSIVGRTWRFETVAEQGATPLPFGEGAGAEIFCFWHQCVLPCTFYFRRTGATIIVSRSFDGELIAHTLDFLDTGPCADRVRAAPARGCSDLRR